MTLMFELRRDSVKENYSVLSRLFQQTGKKSISPLYRKQKDIGKVTIFLPKMYTIFNSHNPISQV